MSATIEMVFPNKQYAKKFMSWLDNSGEQDYFSDIDLSVNNFKYDYNHLIIIGMINGKLHLQTKEDS